MDEQRTKEQNQERDDAAFWPRGASRKPLGSLVRCIQESADAHSAAIRRAVEKSLRPIPRAVKTDGKPQSALQKLV